MPVLVCHKEINNSSIIYFMKYFFCTISPQRIRSLKGRRKNRYRSASLTAEAALVFPVFFFTVFLLWQCFLLLLFQLSVCHEVTKAAMDYSYLGYAERRAAEQNVEISWMYQPLLWNSIPENERVKSEWVTCETQEDGTIRVEVSYRFLCEAPLMPKLSLPVTQSFGFYPYQGEYASDLFSAEEKQDVVYVTESGTVYHKSRACVYLTVTVRQVSRQNITEERNSFGKKYTECSRCGNMEHTESVYVSSGGTKYHWSLTCSSLKRTVMEKSKEEVEGMPACHKCGTEEDKK